MAVAPEGTERLAQALSLLSQVFHRDGVFLEIARANRIRTGFLEQQAELWRGAACNRAAGATQPGCVLPALDTALAPTAFAGRVAAVERWILEATGLRVSLAMLKTEPAWDLFRAGVVNSLLLVAGSLVATLVFALVLGALLGAGPAPLRWPAQGLVAVMQSSPVVLTLVIAAALAQAAFGYSAATALGAAVVALGLTNGSYAGQAIGEALRSEVARGRFDQAVALSATQIMSFLINAAKGTPIASFVGAPELLGTLTDITSFASGRGTTYTLVLVFYLLVVMAVVWLCGRLRAWLERRVALP
jgi:ABC-type amino acid transport system permease subunit